MSSGRGLEVLSRPGGLSGVDVPRPARRWATRVGLPALVVLATLGLLVYSSRDLLRPAASVRVAPAVVVASSGGASAETTQAPAVVQAPGWVEPSPYAITVPALAEGVVREVLVLEGERVEQGQVVARLIDDEARLAERAAAALVAERLAEVERARAALATAEAQAEVERATLEELRDEVERKAGLVEAGAVSPGEHRRLQIRLRGAEARLSAAERTAEEARAALGSAEAQLGSARVQHESARWRLSWMEVRSPAAGVVLERLVAPGVHVSTGSMREGDMGHAGGVLRLYQPGSLQARVDVPLADAGKVRPGCRAQVVCEALPDRPIDGVVTRVVPEASLQRNTVQFKVALANPPEVLKPEMLVRVRLLVESPEGSGAGSDAPSPTDGVLVVPAGAVRSVGEGRAEAWVVAAGARGWVAQRRQLQAAPASDPRFVAASAGLRLGDRVILDPPPGLREGDRVRVAGEAGVAAGGPASRQEPQR